MSEAKFITAPRRGWLQALLIYRQPRLVGMLLLGFSSGLPFYLIFQTLSAWLRQEGIARTTIGMFSWVGLMFTIKFLWAPIVDRAPLPLIGRLLGRRRSWMLLAQIGIAFGLFNLSLSEPAVNVAAVVWGALFVAFCAATQDIAVDAWRIESAANEEQGAMAAAYQLGYRLALICGSAGTMGLAAGYGWQVSYTVMAALAGVGMLTTLVVKEPHPREPPSDHKEERVVRWLTERPHWPDPLRRAGAAFVDAVVCPLVEFFSRYGLALGIAILVFMGCYRLTDFTMGSMTNTFYIDKGYTLGQIATVVKSYSIIMSMVGVLLAGVVIARIGVLRALVLSSFMVMISNLGFALLATTAAPTLVGLGAVNCVDFLAIAFHGTSLIAFLSSLTSPKYTATQYALFSSVYALPGKILEGFSGRVVDHIGYPSFFVYTASLSIPGLMLLAWIVRRSRDRPLFK